METEDDPSDTIRAILTDEGDFEGRFDLTCPDCTFTYRAASYGEAAEYSRGHRDHTGHDCSWNLPDGFEELAIDVNRFAVHCSECGLEQQIEGRVAAEGFVADHERYTDHGAAAVSHTNIKAMEKPSPNELLERLEFVIPEFFVGGIPEPVLFASLVQQGRTAAAADRELGAAFDSGSLDVSYDLRVCLT